MRQDGPFIEAGENDNLIVQRLEADPNAVGIFGYSFLYENQDKLQGVKIDGVEPGFDTIADGSYGLSRPLFFYIKNAHRNVIPGMDEFIAEYTSDASMGEDGYLHERGLVVLSEDKLKEMQDRAKDAREDGCADLVRTAPSGTAADRRRGREQHRGHARDREATNYCTRRSHWPRAWRGSGRRYDWLHSSRCSSCWQRSAISSGAGAP